MMMGCWELRWLSWSPRLMFHSRRGTILEKAVQRRVLDECPLGFIHIGLPFSFLFLPMEACWAAQKATRVARRIKTLRVLMVYQSIAAGGDCAHPLDIYCYLYKRTTSAESSVRISQPNWVTGHTRNLFISARKSTLAQRTPASRLLHS